MPVEAPSQSIITYCRKQLFEIYPDCTQTLQYRCIQDIVEAEKIWKYFTTTPENIYQDWEYIKIFHEAYQYTPHFYTAFENNIPVACLPLEWIPERNRLEMFGTRSTVHHLFFQDGYEHLLEKLIQNIDLSYFTESIFWDSTSTLPIFLKQEDINFSMNLKNMDSAEMYIRSHFSSESAGKILRGIRKVEALGIEMRCGDAEDLEYLFQQNKNKFGEISAFKDIRRQENFRKINNTTKISPLILSFLHHGNLVGVQFLIRDGSILRCLNGGINGDINNLGKYILIKMIDYACENNYTLYDPGAGDLGWKDAWCDVKIPLYGMSQIKSEESDMFKNIEYHCINDIVEAEKIWKYFHSIPKNIYQDWEYIKIFHEAYQYTPHFYTAYKDNLPVACLPLEWVEEKSQLRMFGNRSYIHYFMSLPGEEKVLDFLISQVQQPIFVESIEWNHSEIPKFLEQQDINYCIHLENYDSAETYIRNHFSSSNRRNTLKHIRQVKELGIEMKNGKQEDLFYFFEQNKRRFGEKSGYNDLRRQKNILLMNETPSLQPHILSFYIKEELVAVQFIIQNGDTFYQINGGVKEGINNLGKYTIYSMLEYTIDMGGKIFDPGPTDLGWKETWCDTKSPLYGLKINQK